MSVTSRLPTARRPRRWTTRLSQWLPKGTTLPEETWNARHRLLRGVMLAHVPLLVVIAWHQGIEPTHVLAELGVLLALMAASCRARSRVWKAALGSAALITCSALLVHYTGGLIESHFHFFVVIPLISLYRDWRPLATGIVYVVAHHGLVGVLYPEAVYNHPAALANPVRWALIHGAYVAMATAVILGYWRFSEDLEGALAREEKLRLHAEKARHRAEAERLADIVKAKDRFVASVSHELRTPLTAVLGFAEILRDTEDSLSPEERAELVATLAKETYDLVGIVNDLLVAARAEEGTIQICRVPVDLRANAAQVVEGLPDDDRRRVMLGQVDRPCLGLGDPVRVRQIIRNLVTNAVRYGGPNIWFGFGYDTDTVSVTVCDDGDGIPLTERTKVFEPYHSAKPRHTQPASVGLGLAVARQLAELMGGSLTYSRPGKVSIFELELPAAASADDGQLASSADALATTGPGGSPGPRLADRPLGDVARPSLVPAGGRSGDGGGAELDGGDSAGRLGDTAPLRL